MRRARILVQRCLKPLGFKKKALNFDRQHGALHQRISLQKSAWSDADSICFTFNLCAHPASPDSAPRAAPADALHVRMGHLDAGRQGDVWYHLDGQRPDIFERKRQMAQTQQEVLHDLQTLALPFLAQLKLPEQIEPAIQRFYGHPAG